MQPLGRLPDPGREPATDDEADRNAKSGAAPRRFNEKRRPGDEAKPAKPEPVVAVCPNCFMAIPATGICDNCG